jgi:hypothetical protein
MRSSQDTNCGRLTVRAGRAEEHPEVTSRNFVALAVACAAALAGCPGTPADGVEAPLKVATEGGIRFVEGQGSMASLEPEQRDLARLAVATLASDLGVPEERVLVDTVRAVDWPDSSLGCPQPGQAYLQVLTPGHKITLRVDGQFHFVHEARGKAFVCRRAKAAVGGVTPKLELGWGEQAIWARQDLARRLGVPVEDIRLVSAESRSWEDSSLGCPVEGEESVAGRVKGYVLTLSHRGKSFTYHTDLSRTIPCPPISAD